MSHAWYHILSSLSFDYDPFCQCPGLYSLVYPELLQLASKFIIVVNKQQRYNRPRLKHWLSHRPYGAVHKVRHAIVGQFLPPPLSHFVTHPGTPPESTSHISDPPIFSRPSTKNPNKSPLYKFSLNCSHVFLSGVVFVRSPFCQNTSVTTES